MPVMQCEVLQGQLWMQHTEVAASSSSAAAAVDLMVKKPSPTIGSLVQHNTNKTPPITNSNNSNSSIKVAAATAAAAAVQLLRQPSSTTTTTFKEEQASSMADKSIVVQQHQHHHHINNHINNNNNDNNNNNNDNDNGRDSPVAVEKPEDMDASASSEDDRRRRRLHPHDEEEDIEDDEEEEEDSLLSSLEGNDKFHSAELDDEELEELEENNGGGDGDGSTSDEMLAMLTGDESDAVTSPLNGRHDLMSDDDDDDDDDEGEEQVPWRNVDQTPSSIVTESTTPPQPLPPPPPQPPSLDNAEPEPERRNKRKNFKPRSIVYHQYEEETTSVPTTTVASASTSSAAAAVGKLFVAQYDNNRRRRHSNSSNGSATSSRLASSATIVVEQSTSDGGVVDKVCLTDDSETDDQTAKEVTTTTTTTITGDQPLDLSDNAANNNNNNNNGSSSNVSAKRRTLSQRHSKDTEGEGSRRRRTLGTPMDLSFGRASSGAGGESSTDTVPHPQQPLRLSPCQDDEQECGDVMDLSHRHQGETTSSSRSPPLQLQRPVSPATPPPPSSSSSQRIVNPSLAALSASLLGVQHAAALGYAQAIRDGHHHHHHVDDVNGSSSISGGRRGSGQGGGGGHHSHHQHHQQQQHTPPTTAVDASAMKDYAESTMKELLGLFGLNDMSESITKDVPLPNFSSVKILENMSNTLGGLLPPPPPLPSSTSTSPQAPSMMPTSASLHHRPSPLSSSSKSSKTTTTTTSSKSSPPPPPPSSHPQPLSHVTNEDLYESFHSQVVDSMTKLASLPSSNLIGNPRVILPHNINTILTLAALQKQQQQQQKCSGATTGLPSSSPPPLPPQAPLPPSSSSPSPSPSSKLAAARLLSPSSSSGLPGSGANLSSTSLFRDHHGKSAPVDYARYVKRYFNKFSSALECGSSYCKDLNYREHFHCMDCNSRVFIKKEEMIRHFKWHKKRDESLQHGFLRYSPMDDCTDRFRNCPHNRKQTHYHCIKETCDKVYISTSDVQMHANYHRKDSAIIQEGFQRFRATEDCATSYCAFAGQRTTHFHCRRSNCNFTFKNKADMEKHKTYHIKDEQLNKDGFKKFMKHEPCSFDNCRFSRVCNHIHCIRQGCSYVLHSSGQLYSHKRKHERRDNEMAYRKFKLAQSMMRSLGENQLLALQSFNDELKGSAAAENSSQMHGSTSGLQTSPGAMSLDPASVAAAHGLTPDSTTANYTEALQQSFAKYSSFLAASGGNMHLDTAANLSPHGFLPGMDQFMMMDLNAEFLKARSEEIWKKYCSRYTANDPCKPHCDLIYKDHYHCNTESCSMVFRSKDGVRDHARCHEQQDQVTEAFFTSVDAGQTGVCFANCPHQGKERHYHCGWQNCQEVIMATDKPFRRLDHYKMHEYSHKMSMAKDPLGLSLASSAFDGIFKRKRGRPPKNRVVEFPISSPSGSTSDQLPQAIYTSFKLLKPNNVPVSSLMDKTHGVMPSTSGHVNSACSVTPKASLSPVASSSSTAATHLDIQTKVEIHEGFYVFPEGLSCPSQPGCPYTGQLHYHCTRARCFYVTDRADILVLHSKDFHDNIEIAEGFAFFDRNVNCRLPGCQSNQVTRHFHCTRPHCNYSFVRYSTMSMHERKHQDLAAIDRFFNSGGADDDDDDDDDADDYDDGQMTAAAATSAARKLPPTTIIKQEFPAPSSSPIASTPTPPTTMSDSRTPSPGGSSNGGKTSVVKAAGTYYPLSAFPHPYHTSSGGGDKKGSTPVAVSDIKREPASIHDQSIDLTTLAESHVAYGTERSCGRPFCKLKRRDHVHCTFCNQGFTQLSHLQPHIEKHLSGSTSPTESSSNRRQPANSDDDFSDRPDDDGGGGDDHRRLRNDDQTSDESNQNSSSHHQQQQQQSHSRFVVDAMLAASKRTSPPSHQSVPPPPPPPPQTQPLSYSASFLATSAAAASSSSSLSAAVNPNPVDLLHAFSVSMPGCYPNMLSRTPINSDQDAGNGSNIFSSITMQQQQQQQLPRNGNPDFEHDSLSDSSESDRDDGSLTMQRRNKRHLDASAEESTAKRAAKMQQLQQQQGMRVLKDEPVPTGYVRYRFNEDCRYTHCGYREHQTHFHCVRSDCGYSFCDKTRFVQHTARHERLDTLMGGDFQQFRANVPCGRPSCVYTLAPGSLANKASHFHCLKCEFVCTDTNKVVAHRRQHQKLDSIMAAGFEKFTAVQPCQLDGCAYNQRQTHYHCTKCQYAVLGLSQMSSHKFRHLEG